MSKDYTETEWFSLDDIRPLKKPGPDEELSPEDQLYCIAVDSPTKQFLITEDGIPTHNTDEGKAEDALKGEAKQIIGSIARLGRAAGVHLLLATQQPRADIIPSETRDNLTTRVNCGTTKPIASGMILNNGEGARVKGNPKGRLYVQVHGSGDHAQGFFADPSWIDEWLESKGLNPDGTPISQPKRNLPKQMDSSEFEGTTLDDREGTSKEDYIRRLREEDEQNDQARSEGMRTGSDTLEDEDFIYERVDEDDLSSDGLNDENLSDDSSDGDSESAPSSSGSQIQDLPTEPTEDNPIGRPKFTGAKAEMDKYHRPEDDWDDFMDNLKEDK